MIGLIIYTLATFGLSALIVDYDGPWEIFLKLRNKFKRSPFNCAVCLSVWVALILFIPIALGHGNWLAPFSAVGVVVLIERLT